MNKVECIYHQGHLITNFCKHPSCFLPLCTECINIHTNYHREQNLHGDFDSIENISSFCIDKLSIMKNKYDSYQTNFNELINLKKEIQEEIMKALNQSKKKLIDLIDNYFNYMTNDCIQKFNSHFQDFHGEIEFNTSQIKEKSQEITQVLKDLNTNKSMKTLIQLYSSKFIPEHLYFQNKLEETKIFLESQHLILIPNDAILNNINQLLSNYIRLIPKKFLNNTLPPPEVERSFNFGNNFNRPLSNVIERPISSIMHENEYFRRITPFGSLQNSPNIIRGNPFFPIQENHRYFLNNGFIQNNPF